MSTLSSMSRVPRSPVPITSAAELMFWWAEVLSEPDAADQALSLLWLDAAGHRLGRVLSISGAAAHPGRRVIGTAAHHTGHGQHRHVQPARGDPSVDHQRHRSAAGRLPRTADRPPPAVITP
ncbi:hypothetical protein [Blastococcus sp. SYSU D00695]